MNVQDYINMAASKGPDMSKAQGGGGGGDYQAPPEGPVLLRLVGYIELGRKRDDFQGEVKIKEKVKLIFECHGKNYPNNDRITITETLSMHEKSNFRKLFLAMRGGDESITHMAQLLGKGFRGRIKHRRYTGNDGKERIYPKLKDDSGYTIGPPVTEDPVTGEVRIIDVPPAKTDLKIFLWQFATKEMWDSIYIPGEYSEGRSKNVLQQEIMQALNWKGSPMDQILDGPGIEGAMDAVDTTPPKTGGAFRPGRPAAMGRPTASRPPALTPHPNPFDDNFDGMAEVDG